MSFISKVASMLSGTAFHYNEVMSKQNDFNKSYGTLLSNKAAIVDYNKQLLEIAKVLEDQKYEGLEKKYEEMEREFNKKYDGIEWKPLLEFSKGLVEKMENNIDANLKFSNGLTVSILKEKKIVFEYVENNYKNYFKYQEEKKELNECKKSLIEKKIIMSDYRSIKINIGILESQNIGLQSECNHKESDLNTAKIHRRNHSKNR